MEFIIILVICAAVFLVCWLVDKAFHRLFRNKIQQKNGDAVRLNKRFSIGGILLSLLGVLALINGIGENMVLLVGGLVILATGIGMIVYYLSFGIYYDEDSFLVTGFCKKDRTYQYNQIRFQKLYVITGGNLLVELHMTDGTAVQVYSQMVGTKAFMDKAFLGWVRQKNIDVREISCEPDEYRWFPDEEEA